ncbi:hypothetical protein GQ457_04G015040 [Hibiscus cannabinus]
MMLDASTRGKLLDRPPHEGLEILDKLAKNDYQHPTTKSGSYRQNNVTKELDNSDSISAQLSTLTNSVKHPQKTSNTHEIKVIGQFYELCGNNHDFSECP